MEEESMANRYLLEDMIRSILLRLPVKSLLRFRCLCHNWNSLTRDPSFASSHARSSRPSTNEKILLNYLRSDFLLLPAGGVPERLYFPSSDSLCILAHCDGIICGAVGGSNFLWNPVTGQRKHFSQSRIGPPGSRYYVIGFGFSSIKDDYIAIRHVYYYLKEEGYRCRIGVELYSLRTDCWGDIGPLPDSIVLSLDCSCSYTIDGAICWFGYDHCCNNHKHVIVLFDMADQTFWLVTPPGEGVNLTALKGSLAYITQDVHVHVWVTEDFRDAGSWIKLFFVALPLCLRTHYGFLDTGEFLFADDDGEISCFFPLT